MYITTAQFEHDYNEDRGFAAACGSSLLHPDPEGYVGW